MLDSIRRYGGSDLGVCRRGLRLFGDLGSILTRAGRIERVPVVLTQLEQWLVVCKANFARGSPELESLQELYEVVLRGIEDSDHVTVKHDEDVGKDTQDLDMTHRLSKYCAGLRQQREKGGGDYNNKLRTIHEKFQSGPSTDVTTSHHHLQQGAFRKLPNRALPRDL
jgi:hypothetical protein